MEKSVQVENNEDSIKKSRSVEKNKIQNETITTELHFELLKQYAWLSSAIIGAVVILIQLKAARNMAAHRRVRPILATFRHCFTQML